MQTIPTTRARRAVRNLRSAPVDPTTLSDIRWSACFIVATLAFALITLAACAA